MRIHLIIGLLATLLLGAVGAYAQDDTITFTPDTDITTTTPVTFTAPAGFDRYFFFFRYSGTDKQSYYMGAVDTNTITYTFNRAGQYQVGVYLLAAGTTGGEANPTTGGWRIQPISAYQMAGSVSSGDIVVTDAAAPLTAVKLILTGFTQETFRLWPIENGARVLSAPYTSLVFGMMPSGGSTNTQYRLTIAMGGSTLDTDYMDDYGIGETLPLSAIGPCTVTAYAKDGSTVVSDSITFEIAEGLSGVSLSTTGASSPMAVGQWVRFLATPTGGTRWWYRYTIERQTAGGGYTEVGSRDETFAPMTTWVPTEPGTYRITVTCHERSIGTTVEFTDSLTFVVKPRISAVAVSAAAKVAPGGTVSATATVSGGLDPRVRFLVGHRNTPNGLITWDRSRDYGTDDTVTFTAGGSGYYVIRAYAREADSLLPFQAAGDATVAVIEPLSSVFMKPSATPRAGVPVTFAAMPAGGADPEYRFFQQIGSAPAVELTNGFTANPSITVTLPSGPVTMIVYVREQGTSLRWAFRKAQSYNVAP